MKLAELAARIAEKSGITSAQAEGAVNALKETIAEELKNNEKFYLYGLGSLQIHTRKARKARNPRSGEILDIPPKRVIKWSSSKAFEALSGAGAGARTSPPSAQAGGMAPAAVPSGTKGPQGFVVTTAAGISDESSPMDMLPDFLSAGSPAAIEEPPTVAPSPTVAAPVGAMDEERMIRRARSMAKVNVDDIFLYYSDALKEALAKGEDPETVVADHLSQARKTLARRVGEAVAAREDFIGDAFKAKMETFPAN